MLFWERLPSTRVDDVLRRPQGVAWVVQHAGAPVGRGKGTNKDPAVMAPAYDLLARKKPLQLARAWLRCLKSVGEGGFVLTDFKPAQFMLGAEGDVWLVDGPAPNDGPLMDYLIKRFAPEDPLLTSGLTSAKGTKVLDFRPGRPQTCTSASFEASLNPADVPAKACARRTYSHHACDPGALLRRRCEGNSTGAPEIFSCKHHACAPFDAHAHVWDAAAKDWLLPRIIALSGDKKAAARLRAASARMLRALDMRPGFDEVLAGL